MAAAFLLLRLALIAAPSTGRSDTRSDQSAIARNVRYQFGLRSLLIATTLLGIALGLFRVALASNFRRSGNFSQVLAGCCFVVE